MIFKPKAEALFESFCDNHAVSWESVPTGKAPTPDYIISLDGQNLYFEVKQIDEDCDFQMSKGVSSRAVGAHVRQKISDSKKQVQVGSRLGAPSILLVYNNLDPMQAFGTEQHDFLAAMYGEMTVALKDSRIVDSYYGRNSSLRDDRNTSFSAVGHLRHSDAGPIVKLYENAFARIPLNVVSLPACFEVVYVEVSEHAA